MNIKSKIAVHSVGLLVMSFIVVKLITYNILIPLVSDGVRIVGWTEWVTVLFGLWWANEVRSVLWNGVDTKPDDTKLESMNKFLKELSMPMLWLTIALMLGTSTLVITQI